MAYRVVNVGVTLRGGSRKVCFEAKLPVAGTNELRQELGLKHPRQFTVGRGQGAVKAAICALAWSRQTYGGAA
jgi:hypothetical protein